MKKKPKTKKQKGKRIAFPCEVCGTETVASRKLEVIAFIDEIYHISEWRVCPLREKETGCGHWQLFNYKIPVEEMEKRKKEEQDQNPPSVDV